MSQRPSTYHPISRIPKPISQKSASTWQFRDIPNYRQIFHDLVSHSEKRRIEYLEGCLHWHCNFKMGAVRTPASEESVRAPPPFQNVCNTSVVLYEVYKPNSAISVNKRFQWGPLLELWFKARPKLLLEGRKFFAAGKWLFSESGNIDDRIDGLIAEHIELCNWLSLRAAQYRQLDVPNMFLPTMKAIMMIYWPTVLVALVLTGDCSRMKSGPISWGRLWNDRPPGYNNTERVVYVKPERAVAFLAWIDRREVAANPELRLRNENAARRLERRFVSDE